MWKPDILDGYEQLTFELGPDPDGEGDVVATLVRRSKKPKGARGAVLWVHGFTDYFFQTDLADFLAERGFAFYALDLRKCGRSHRDGQSRHYVSDLALYDAELNLALATIVEETGLPVLLGAHSTGGLVLPLWLQRLNATIGTREAGIIGQFLDAPFFDLPGKPWMRGPGTQLIHAMAKVRPLEFLNLPKSSAYGESLHADHHGEWHYDLEWKPLGGVGLRYGWVSAIRRGHAELHKGLDVGVPSLVLRSDKSGGAMKWSPKVDTRDAVLDVRHIVKWSGCLGDAVTSLPIKDARHDVFLSLPEPRAAVYAALDRWLETLDIPSVRSPR